MDRWINHYGVLVFLFGAALVLFGRAGRNRPAAIFGGGCTVKNCWI